MENLGTIIQFGSGKPGEEDSAAFEQALFRELGLKNPSILFIPFHELPPGANDWVRFQEIYRPLTTGSIELLELPPFERHPQSREVLRRLRQAQIIVLGSGLVEPYVASIGASELAAPLIELHRQGTVFFGYSAGSLTLGSEFCFHQSGEELLDFLEELLQTALKNYPLKDAITGFREMLHDPPPAEDLIEMMERRRVSGRNSLLDEPFFTQLHAMLECPGLELVPRIVAYPHFGESLQCQPEHLRLGLAKNPKILHVGVPNAMAIVTTFGPMGPRMQVRGKNYRHPLTWIDTAGRFHTCADREELPSISSL